MENGKWFVSGMGVEKEKAVCVRAGKKYGKKVEGATDESLYFFWQPTSWGGFNAKENVTICSSLFPFFFFFSFLFFFSFSFLSFSFPLEIKKEGEACDLDGPQLPTSTNYP